MGKVKIYLYELWWRVTGYPDQPPLVFKIEPKIHEDGSQYYYPRYQHMALMYLNGHTIESIAELNGVTRERVRQCIWKAYREST